MCSVCVCICQKDRGKIQVMLMFQASIVHGHSVD